MHLTTSIDVRISNQPSSHQQLATSSSSFSSIVGINWTNIIHMTAILLNPAYLFNEEGQELSYHTFIMRDFHKYISLLAQDVLKITGEEELKKYIHNMDKELDGIDCFDGTKWTHVHREKALFPECRATLMHWWAQADQSAPLLGVIAMNILGLTYAVSASEQSWSSDGYVHSLSRVRLAIPR
ncbi:hypothetical protein R1flu_004534 [Riccia fluitans]|uniref:HAT C-terminal dimerisation domain-containing protein n=1 Tax=Riccia fluitans TaxID=41844 RepID=A0ABD1YRE3_9MARC